MAAGQYFEVEFRGRMPSPIPHGGWCCGVILRCGEGGNRHAEGGFGQQTVSLVSGEIGTHRSDKEVQYLTVLIDCCWNSAVASLKSFHKFVFREGVDCGKQRSQVRRPASTNEKVFGCGQSQPAQRSRKLKCHQSAKTVPIKGEWLIRYLRDAGGNSVHQVGNAGERPFPKSLSSSGKFHGDALDFGLKQGNPGKEGGRASSGVGQAEQAQRGVRFPLSYRKN